ncbi:MAG: dephospho-CoA kinase [Firmicutes bacterium]|nr:dephospho-CoA kinase [Bacillota bacterium]
MRVIGLTGGIASGKSLVSRLLRELGALVIDADQIAREVVEPGKPAYHSILREFGNQVLNPDGSLNRQALGRLVFSDPRKLERLNQITHPLIIAEIQKLLKSYRLLFPEKAVVLDAPLLYEAGLESIVDEVWVVYVDYPTQLQRLMERDGLTREEARRRIEAQLPLEEKVKRADRVIDNRGTPEETALQVRKFWNEIAKSQ